MSNVSVCEEKIVVVGNRLDLNREWGSKIFIFLYKRVKANLALVSI